jgi:hypothetical protein
MAFHCYKILSTHRRKRRYSSSRRAWKSRPNVGLARFLRIANRPNGQKFVAEKALRLVYKSQKYRFVNRYWAKILCADKNDAVVKYSLPENNTQIFASKYLLSLPTEEQLLE